MLSLRSSFSSRLCLVFTGNIRNVSCVWWYITSTFIAFFLLRFSHVRCILLYRKYPIIDISARLNVLVCVEKSQNYVNLSREECNNLYRYFLRLQQHRFIEHKSHRTLTAFRYENGVLWSEVYLSKVFSIVYSFHVQMARKKCFLEHSEIIRNLWRKFNWHFKCTARNKCLH